MESDSSYVYLVWVEHPANWIYDGKLKHDAKLHAVMATPELADMVAFKLKNYNPHLRVTIEPQLVWRIVPHDAVPSNAS